MPDTTFHALRAVANSPLRDCPIAVWCHPLLVRAAPIVLEHGIFQIHPGPAREGAWRPVMAIRDGFPSWSDQERAIGGDIIDLAAISLNGDRVIGTLLGLADAIGSPQSEPSRSIHLRGSPAAWLRGCDGAVLTRSLAASADWLRQFDVIVADTPAHGEGVQAALRRAYRGPDIRVAA